MAVRSNEYEHEHVHVHVYVSRVRARRGYADRALGALLVAVALAACGGDDSHLPIDELQNPSTCMECHPKHYTQWSGSMHAYAAPAFRTAICAA